MAEQLHSVFGFEHVKSSHFITERGKQLQLSRDVLQAYGEKLDRKTGGAWVRDDFLKLVPDDSISRCYVIDAVRIQGQIEALRQSFGRKVVHVHLRAELPELEKRYKRRKERLVQGIKEMHSYAQVLQNETEKNVNTLGDIADVEISSDRCTRQDILIRVASHIGWYGREYSRLVDVMVGGQYGSEGKGQVAAYLSSEYDLLVRVGGPNAGHKVKIDNSSFTFRHLPSGTLSSRAQLAIGPGAVLHVPTLLKEISDCRVDSDRLSIDPQAMIISEQDKGREAGLMANIGSTGQGVGEATARRILSRGLPNIKFAKDVPLLQPFVRELCGILEDAFRQNNKVFLEGTQGTGLSLYHGSYPFVTSRDTTVAGCLAESGISPSRVRKVIMVCRTYPIRVKSPKGKDSGPMSQKVTWAEVERRAGFPMGHLSGLEKGSVSGNLRRVGEFDWTLLRKAASLNAPTDVAITFADYIKKENENARRFEQLTIPTIRFIEEVERVAAAPVTLISTRFHIRSIIDRRAW